LYTPFSPLVTAFGLSFLSSLGRVGSCQSAFRDRWLGEGAGFFVHISSHLKPAGVYHSLCKTSFTVALITQCIVPLRQMKERKGREK
jgi:hypothetical protein